MAQRESGNECLGILEGSARVLREGQEVAHLGSGDAVGELSLLDGLPRTATVVADEPTEILVIPNRDFQRLLNRNARLTYKLLVSVGGRLRTLTEHAPAATG